MIYKPDGALAFACDPQAISPQEATDQPAYYRARANAIRALPRMAVFPHH
jgi:hypothetical protein